MKRIDVEPMRYHLTHGRWSLFRDEKGAHYLLVSCEQPRVDFYMLIRMNESEYADYHGLGWLALQYLAHRVSYFSREYLKRAIQGEMFEKAIALSRI